MRRGAPRQVIPVVEHERAFGPDSAVGSLALACFRTEATPSCLQPPVDSDRPCPSHHQSHKRESTGAASKHEKTRVL